MNLPYLSYSVFFIKIHGGLLACYNVKVYQLFGLLQPVLYSLAIYYSFVFSPFISCLNLVSWCSFLQDDLEVHYSGFKTPHIHNLSDLVQESLGDQVCKI